MAALLTDLRALILNSRPAYRDFLGETTELKTTKILENVVLTNGGSQLLPADPAFSGFVSGESYRVILNGEETSIVASGLANRTILSNVSDFQNLPDDYWAVYSDAGSPGKIVASASGSSTGATISVYYDETVTTQKWSVRKLAYELLPDRLLSALSAVANTARKAQSAADAAKSVADNIVPAAASQGVAYVNIITDIGDISGISGGSQDYKAKGLNIKVNSTVTVFTRDFGFASMSWDGYSATATLLPSRITISLDYEVGTDTYTLRTTSPNSVTVEKMEYTKVPTSAYGTVALPYLQFSHILLYSNSGTGKLFKITADDAGTLSATEVTDTTT